MKFTCDSCQQRAYSVADTVMLCLRCVRLMRPECFPFPYGAAEPTDVWR